ncbi:N-acetyl-gamma-glutamyl-phosphate reductase [Paludibacter sp. 221]|uniref:N-acetyl-gamma-glutamyl-phosphate reductase n=1 Tax=Paludibacter sp. 221 TaxID=2302939 RepID=UPI0013D22A7C|nr:N-acetyl-gamma-glutamyl-phosphate reductase [Paludibacter sp. 221]NDV46578.1 N-acetyl-gamma-glutamyl-phosphate reductase [Paludibacter sp. 221]
MSKIKVGVIGGAGYTAGELLRILVFHPQVEIVFVNSSSNAGNKIADIHSGLVGDTDLVFTSELPFEKVDALFLCSAHGDSRKFMEANNVPRHIKIIDLSTDYRAKSPEHDFVYGLPELNRDEIKKASRIANPGCFATAIQVALLPLASKGLLTDEVHINAITGSTGAGVKPSSTSHFSWRNNNISVYKAFGHQHLQEIGQSVRQLQPGFEKPINFIPVRGDFARGIFVTAYTRCSMSLEEAYELYHGFYKDSAFTFVVDENPDMKQVVNTNKAIVYLEKHDDKLFIISAIDNLLKGASGQAVQNMNLMFGLDEKTGLNLKSIGF